MAEGDLTSKASEVPKVVAGLMALVALAASIFSGNDPLTTLTRGAVAFVAGYIIATLWFVVTGRQVVDESKKDEDKTDETEAEDAKPELELEANPEPVTTTTPEVTPVPIPAETQANPAA